MTSHERLEGFRYIPTEQTDSLLIDNPCFDLPSWKNNDPRVHDPVNTDLTIHASKEQLLDQLDILGIADNSIITSAFAIATEAHSNKFRKASGKPYIVHPIDVSYILSFVPVVGSIPEVQAAAITHDVIEDSPLDINGNKEFTLEMLRRELGDKTATYVELLTADEPEGEIPQLKTEDYYWWWRAKKQTAMNKVLEDRTATIIKTADFLSNTFDFVCDRGLLDNNDKPLGNRVFDQFKVSQTSMLARITHGSIDLSVFYKDRYHENNPLALSLLDRAVALIKDSSSEERENSRMQGIEWGLDPLYKDWISDLRREQFAITNQRFRHR